MSGKRHLLCCPSLSLRMVQWGGRRQISERLKKLADNPDQKHQGLLLFHESSPRHRGTHHLPAFHLDQILATRAMEPVRISEHHHDQQLIREHHPVGVKHLLATVHQSHHMTTMIDVQDDMSEKVQCLLEMIEGLAVSAKLNVISLLRSRECQSESVLRNAPQTAFRIVIGKPQLHLAREIRKTVTREAQRADHLLQRTDIHVHQRRLPLGHPRPIQIQYP